MLTVHALTRQTNSLESIFFSAEVELNGVLIPAELIKTRQSNSKVTFLVRIPATDIGTVTKRIVKDESGQIVWQDTVNFFKPEREVALSIPIELKWKVGE
ncbi:hypothetical protein [Brevibacillus sp. MER 51]|uniref:hypothetical protein n=1 Tax=Brevibacillus sp. MER 51 TaxID=2939560 RepID=UPI00204094FA|nr:hypothetical protein [Brevibacillus sp. MER 51]MCM3144382.1 hypothetical protein [Brevibacillus sp. MER 51]